MAQTPPTDAAALMSLLGQLSIASTTVDHEAVFTIEEQSRHVALEEGSLLTKNLFVKDKKHGMFLVTALASREINMKQVATMLKLTGANLRFCEEAALMEKLGVMRGSVSPFALINDKAGEVTFVIDKALTECGQVLLHPLTNTKTTSLAPKDLESFLEHVKHKATVLDFDAAPALPPAPPKGEAGKNPPKDAPQKKVKSAQQNEEGTKLGLTVTKDQDISLWYTQILTLAEMIDYSDISGCYILRPWSYSIWESIQTFLDCEFKKEGVQNSYFPIFASKKALETEKDHIEGFAAEVAWVTKSGSKDLMEPIAIRPTSETIMYPFYAKWIRSHRDLPLQLNQWNNVVRWEFKDATPFLRSREFLWQEGHTAHASYKEAQEMTLKMLELYRRVYEELLAVPVIKGMKTEVEKFAGGYHTTTVEAYINGTGRAIQGATSHNLGQNFGKMFKIQYEDENREKQIPWQTSFGMTTRTIGVCVLVHGDDKGLVMPPRIAPLQVIVIPIPSKDLQGEADLKSQEDYVYDIRERLRKAGMRCDVDTRNIYTPGWKYNHWEQKGVPVRVEVGPRDLNNQTCRLVLRDNNKKMDIPLDELTTRMPELLEEMQARLLEKAKAGRDEKMVTVMQWADFVPALNKQCLVLTPFCDETEWEEKVKKMSREEALNGEEEADTCSTSVAAKTLCKPFDQPPLPPGTPCFVSGKPATTWVLWGRSY